MRNRTDEPTMPDGHSQYVGFLNLAAEWSEASGAPIPIVLRRLGEWAVAGGFPDGAFVRSSGDEIAALDLLIACRLVVGNGRGRLGEFEMHKDPATEIDLLQSVLVPTQAVFEFCDRTNTRPPSSLRGGLGLLFAGRDRRKNSAPPECPDVEEHVVRQFARRNAVADLGSLRATISGLKGKPGHSRLRRPGNESLDLEYLQDRWAVRSHSVQENIRRCGDQGLQQELEALESEWQSFVAEQHAKAESTAADATGEDAVTEAPALREPRLRISKAAGRGQFDGCELKLTPTLFNVLSVLAEAAAQGKTASKRELEKLLQPRELGEKALAQAIKRLKQKLAVSGVDKQVAQGVIVSHRAYGYRLGLPASDIQIDS